MIAVAPRKADVNEVEARRILAAVSQASGVRAATLMGWNRSSSVALARQVLQFMLVKNLEPSGIYRVARYMGVDHSSVCYAIQRVEWELERGGPRALLLSQAAVILPTIKPGQPIAAPPPKPSDKPKFDPDYKMPVGFITKGGAIICHP